MEKDISNNEKARGQRHYTAFSVLNAMSFICLADSLFILFALKMGCPDYIVAVFSAFMYLGNVAMFLARRMIAGMGAAKTIAVFWVVRNLAGLLAASAPYFNAFSEAAGISVLAVASLIFYLCHSGGVLAMQPLVGEITYPDRRGRFVSNVYLAYNITAVLGFACLIYLFRDGSSLELFQGILTAGASFGLLSVFFIIRVKETDTPRVSAALPIKNELRKLVDNPVYRKLLLANILVFSGIVLTVPTSMLALKEGYQLPSYQALFFSLIQFAGGIVIAYATRLLSDETGPRPLIILYFALLILIACLWIAAPADLNWLYVFLIFLLCGCCFMGISMVLFNYFLAAVKPEDRVGASLFISIAVGAGAGLVGAVLGSGTLKALHSFEFTAPLDLYRVYFGIILVLLLPCVFLVSKLEKQKDWAVKDVVGLLFAPRDIRALLLINNINQIEEPSKENHNIHKLESVPSGLSQRKLISYLDSPRFQVRSRAIQALRQMRLEPEAIRALIRELDVGEFTTAFYAAQILGEQKCAEAAPALISKLDSPDNYLKGKAMYALAQLREKSAYKRVEEIFAESDNNRIIIHGALALAEIGDPDALRLLLRKSTEKLQYQALYEILLAVAEISGIPDSFYKFLRHWMIDREVSRKNLLEYIETLSSAPMSGAFKNALDSFRGGADDRRRMIRAILDESSSSSHEINSIIKEFLAKTNPEELPDELVYCVVCVLRKNGAL